MSGIPPVTLQSVCSVNFGGTVPEDNLKNEAISIVASKMKVTCPVLPLEGIFNRLIEKQKPGIGAQSEQPPLWEKSHGK